MEAAVTVLRGQLNTARAERRFDQLAATRGGSGGGGGGGGGSGGGDKGEAETEEGRQGRLLAVDTTSTPGTPRQQGGQGGRPPVFVGGMGGDAPPPSSPIFSDDMGPPSPLASLPPNSPLPVRGSDARVLKSSAREMRESAAMRSRVAELEAKNDTLRHIVGQMRADAEELGKAAQDQQSASAAAASAAVGEQKQGGEGGGGRVKVVPGKVEWLLRERGRMEMQLQHAEAYGHMLQGRCGGLEKALQKAEGSDGEQGGGEGEGEVDGDGGGGEDGGEGEGGGEGDAAVSVSDGHKQETRMLRRQVKDLSQALSSVRAELVETHSLLDAAEDAVANTKGKGEDEGECQKCVARALGDTERAASSVLSVLAEGGGGGGGGGGRGGEAKGANGGEEKRGTGEAAGAVVLGSGSMAVTASQENRELRSQLHDASQDLGKLMKERYVNQSKLIHRIVFKTVY